MTCTLLYAYGIQEAFTPVAFRPISFGLKYTTLKPGHYTAENAVICSC